MLEMHLPIPKSLVKEDDKKNRGTFFHKRRNSNSLISLYVRHVVPRKDLMHIKL